MELVSKDHNSQLGERRSRGRKKEEEKESGAAGGRGRGEVPTEVIYI